MRCSSSSAAPLPAADAFADADRGAGARRPHTGEALAGLLPNVAHEMNNILGTILGHARLAAYEAAPGGAPARSLAAIADAARRGRSLTRRMLGAPPEPHRSFCLATVIEEVLRLVRPSLPTAVRLHRRLAAIGAAQGDPDEVHQMLLNLCLNAGDAMRPGGGILRVALDTVRYAAPRATASGPLAAGFYARVRVGDSGTGIPPASLPRAFEPGYSTKPGGQARGLGLTLAREVAAAHGGAIDVTSAVGRGTTVAVLLSHRAAGERGER